MKNMIKEIEVEAINLYYMEKPDMRGNLYGFIAIGNKVSKINRWTTDENQLYKRLYTNGSIITFAPKKVVKFPVCNYIALKSAKSKYEISLEDWYDYGPITEIEVRERKHLDINGNMMYEIRCLNNKRNISEHFCHLFSRNMKTLGYGLTNNQIQDSDFKELFGDIKISRYDKKGDLK